MQVASEGFFQCQWPRKLQKTAKNHTRDCLYFFQQKTHLNLAAHRQAYRVTQPFPISPGIRCHPEMKRISNHKLLVWSLGYVPGLRWNILRPYCWWLKSRTTWDGAKNPANNGINYSINLNWCSPDSFHQQYEGMVFTLITLDLCIAKSTSPSPPISIGPDQPYLQCPVSVRPELRHPACSKIDFLDCEVQIILTHPAVGGGEAVKPQIILPL